MSTTDSMERELTEPTAPRRRKRILLVSWAAPPNLSGSASIVDNLSRQFSAEEMLIVGQRWRTNVKGEASPRGPRIQHLTTEWTHPRRGQRYVRWMRWLGANGSVRALRRTIREFGADAVVGVFPDEYYLFAAYQAARRENVPLIPYFHNTYRDNRRGVPLKFAEWLEPRVFHESPLVLVMSEGMQSYYQSLHEDVRFEPLVHSFEGPLPVYQTPPPPHSPVRIALLGNLGQSNVDAARRMAEIVNRRQDLSMTIYTGSTDWFLRDIGVHGPRIRSTSVAPDEVVAALQQHDVLYLPHGLKGGLSQVEYDTIFPTRTVPYLLAGRPILAHSPADCFLSRWLLKHDCSVLVDRPDAQALEEALDAVCVDGDIRERIVKNAVTAAAQFHAPLVADRFRSLIAT